MGLSLEGKAMAGGGVRLLIPEVGIGAVAAVGGQEFSVGPAHIMLLIMAAALTGLTLLQLHRHRITSF